MTLVNNLLKICSFLNFFLNFIYQIFVLSVNFVCFNVNAYVLDS